MAEPVFTCSVYFTNHVDGSWTAEAHEHGVIATGATQDEARANVLEAARAKAMLGMTVGETDVNATLPDATITLGTLRTLDAVETAAKVSGRTGRSLGK